MSLAVCSVGGTGFLPRGPATAGAVVGAALWYGLAPGPAAGFALVAATVIVGRLCAPPVMRRSGAKDPQVIVLDEVAGVWMALIGVPLSPGSALAAAVVFRIFDKKKFGPARSLDRRGDAWGVMLDDVAAGVYANIILQLGVRLYHAWLS